MPQPLTPKSTTQQPLSPQREEPQIPGLHHAPNHSQSSIRKKVQDFKEKSLAATFDDVILPTVAEIINGSKDSWRFTVFKSENYSESNGNMTKRDLD